jgi:hypothetical protein
MARDVRAAVQPLHGLRVLLVGGDRSFRRLATALLTRRGHVTDCTDDPAAAPAAMSLLRPKVVVVDGSGWLAAAAETATAFESAAPWASILLVSDSPEFGLAGRRRVVPKWSSFGCFVAEVESAGMERSAQRLAPTTPVAVAG